MFSDDHLLTSLVGQIVIVGMVGLVGLRGFGGSCGYGGPPNLDNLYNFFPTSKEI